MYLNMSLTNILVSTDPFEDYKCMFQHSEHVLCAFMISYRKSEGMYTTEEIFV